MPLYPNELPTNHAELDTDAIEIPKEENIPGPLREGRDFERFQRVVYKDHGYVYPFDRTHFRIHSGSDLGLRVHATTPHTNAVHPLPPIGNIDSAVIREMLCALQDTAYCLVRFVNPIMWADTHWALAEKYPPENEELQPAEAYIRLGYFPPVAHANLSRLELTRNVSQRELRIKDIKRQSQLCKAVRQKLQLSIFDTKETTVYA